MGTSRRSINSLIHHLTKTRLARGMVDREKIQRQEMKTPWREQRPGIGLGYNAGNLLYAIITVTLSLVTLMYKYLIK
jgi:hypothetical protein